MIPGKRHLLILAPVALLALLVYPTGDTVNAGPPLPGDSAATGTDGFLPNLGQWDHPARYVASFGPMTAFVDESGWVMSLRSREGNGRRVGKGRDRARRHHRRQQGTRDNLALRMEFTSSSAGAPRGLAPLAGVHNFYLGQDRNRWRTGVKAYGKLLYRGLYPGVDLQLRRTAGQLEYDLLLEPGADLDRVGLRVRGNTDLSIAKDGSLVIHTAMGEIRQSAPLTWEVDGDGRRIPVPCRYKVQDAHNFGFALTRRSAHLPLVIDPVLDLSTFIGTSSDEYSYAVEVDTSGQVTTIAEVDSSAYPTTVGAYSTTFGGQSDTVVTRFNPTGTALVYSTYLGGSGWDTPFDSAQDLPGNIFIVGNTDSPNFPVTTGAYSTTITGLSDTYIAKLDPTGGQLLYGTFLGGSGDDYPYGIAINQAGTLVTVTGETDSSDYPVTTGAYQTAFAGNADIFVSRLNLGTSPGLVWSTYVGTTDWDVAFGVAVDLQDNAYITGYTSIASFPVTAGAYDTSYNGNSDAFLTCLNPTGTALVYSTFLGGTDYDAGWKVVVDLPGRAFVSGETDSVNYPTTPGCWDATLGGSGDLFVTCFSPSGATLDWSTYLGGSGYEYTYNMAIDLVGNPVVVGETDSTDYPTTPGAWSRVSAGGYDAIMTSFTADGTKLRYSTYMGGSQDDSSWAVATDLPGQHLYMFGDTDSANLPTTAGAYDTTYNGSTDVFLTGFTVEPAGFTTYGTATPACDGRIAAYCLEAPVAGQSGFGLACLKAPPSSSGLLLLAPTAAPAPIHVLGFDLWLGLGSLLLNFPVTSASNGEGSIPLPIPATAQGAHFYCQFIWLNTAACGGVGTLSASEGIDLTVQ